MKYIKDETRFSGKYSNLVFQAISMSIRPYKNKFMLSIFLGFLGRALLLGNTNIIGKWADSLCTKSAFCKEKSGLFQSFNNTDFFILLFILSSTGFLFLIAFRISISRLGTYSAARLYDETTIRVSRFPISFFDTNPVGRIITRFSSDYGAIFRMAGGPLGEFFSITFDIILFFLLIILASPYYIPIVIVSLFLNYYIYKLNQNYLRKSRREHSLSRSPAISHFAETIQGTKTIKTYGKQRIFIDHFLEKLNYYIAHKNKTNILVALFSVQMSFLNMFVLFFTALAGLWLIKMGLVTVGSLGVAFTFIAMTSSTIQVFFEWISTLEDALTGTERMSEYLYKEIEVGARLPHTAEFLTGHPTLSVEEKKQIHSPISVSPATLQVLNLSLRYQPHLSLALDNISFSLKAGEKLGVIGKTGSGKSTLIQALFHLYPFETGRVVINNYEAHLTGSTKEGNAHFIPLEQFRQNIFMLSQDPILYLGTLRENLTNKKTISDSDIMEVAKLVKLEKLILSHPDKLNMPIQEKGANLSAGEKQLICLARCLLQDAPIILMDEATSSIDCETEELIIHSTQNYLQSKTQIIVAHRLSTIKDCDQIIWLHAGKIVMAGKPHHVLPAFHEFHGFQ